MTNEQKRQIVLLRRSGLGYHAIARVIGVSRDQVRGYCKTEGLDGVISSDFQKVKEEIKKGERCANCLMEIRQAKTGRPRRFCSEECRRIYWRVHRAKEGIKGEDCIYQMECKYCHETFLSYANRHRKYCCHDHYIMDRYGKR